MDRRRGNERGSTLPLLAILLVLLVAIAAFGVDLGQQRVVRRDMQALADVVALDMVREIKGRSVTQIQADSTSWQTAIGKSVSRNDSTFGDPPTVQVELGTLDESTRAFTVATGNTIPNAVRATARSQIDFAFAPGTGGATRTAVAATKPLACFSLGSYALGLNSGNSVLLNALVNDALNLNVLSYNGLATANVSLLGIATQLGVGTVDALVALPGLSVGQFYAAVATVLQREGGSTANVQLLQTLSASVGALSPINIGQLLSLTSGEDAALGTSLNVLDLVAASAFVANGDSALAIPGLAVNLGITNVAAALRIIQKPQFGCGGVNEATAKTSQVALTIGGDLLNPPAILGTTATVSMSLSLDIAEANGLLTKIVCGDPTVAHPDLESVLTTDGLVNLQLRVPVTLKVLGIPVLSGTVEIGTAPPTNAQTAAMSFPTLGSYATAHPTGSGNIGLSGLVVDTSDLKLGGITLGLTLAPLVSGILTSVVNPLVANLDSALLTPLLDLLGAQVSGADVFGVARPNCNSSALRQ